MKFDQPIHEAEKQPQPPKPYSPEALALAQTIFAAGEQQATLTQKFYDSGLSAHYGLAQKEVVDNHFAEIGKKMEGFAEMIEALIKKGQDPAI